MKKVKKVVSIFTVATLLSSSVPSLINPAHAAGMTGSGTEVDPYVITTVEDLQDIQNDLSAYYVLGNDIDASATATWNSGKGFVPIGAYTDDASAATTCFTGTLYGDYHLIRNLTINDPSLTEVGLFGCAYTGALIDSTNFEGISVTGSSNVGGITGRTVGTNITIQHISILGNVTGNSDYIGGIVGYAEGAYVYDIDLYIDVTGSNTNSNYVGGIAGIMKNAEFNNSFTQYGELRGHSHLGAIAGSATNNSFISYSGGDLITYGQSYIGGLVGSLFDSRIENSYALGNLDLGGTYGGGFVGYAENSIITRAVSRSNVIGVDMVGGFIGYAGDNVSISQGFPYGAVTSYGNTTGGFAGYVSPTSSITNAFSRSNVQGVGSPTNPTAGFAAINDGTISNVLYMGTISALDTVYGLTQEGTGTVTNSYFDSDVTGTTLTTAGEGKTTAELQDPTTFAGWDFANMWIQSPLKNSGYPYLKGAQLFYELPSPVTGLTANVSTDTVTLNWPASPDPLLHHYFVYVDGAQADLTRNNTWTSGSLSYGAHTFVVTANDYIWQESAPSNVATATIVDPATIPAVPIGLAGADADSQVVLTWTANTEPDLDHYVLYKDGATLASVPAGTETYTATGLTNGTTYSFTISAVNTVPLESAKSAPYIGTPTAPPDTTAPSAPQNLIATNVGSIITLTWDAVLDTDFDKYYIYQDDVKIAESSAPTWTLSLPQGTYEFKVSAVDTVANESAKSNPSSVTIPVPVDTTAPSVPMDLDATVDDYDAILTWTANTDVDLHSYGVYIDGVLVTTVLAGTETYTAENLSVGAHTASITAIDTSGNASANTSDEAFTIVDITAPNAPIGLVGTSSGGKSNLTWIANVEPDLDHYNVYEGGVLVGTVPAGTETWTSSTLPNGTYTYTLTAVDTNGNESAPSSPANVVIYTNPSSGGNSGSGGGNGHIVVELPKDPSKPVVVEVPKDKPSTVDLPAGNTSGTTPPIKIPTPGGTITIDGNTLPPGGGTTVTITPTDKDSLKPGDVPTPIITIGSKDRDDASQPTITISKDDPFGEDQYYTQDPNGTWEHVKPHKDKDGTWVVPIEKPVLGVKIEDKGYTDIDESWAKDAIEKLTNIHVVNGYSDGTFKPNGEITRAEFTSMLVKAVLYKQSTEQFNKFQDVNSTAWYYDAIVDGQNISIIKGISDTLFAPAQTIVKQETVAIAVRWIENNTQSAAENATEILGGFADSQNISGWAREEVAKGIKYGIVQGDTKKEISPKKATTRAEAATIIYNLIEKY